MNKFILGSILAAISLMAIYGTSASKRVASWVDGVSPAPPTQSNFGQVADGANDSGANDQLFVALNDTDQDFIAQVSVRTPLEKAGDIPQRQTQGVQSAPAFGTNAQSADTGDDTDGEIVTPSPPAQTTPAQPSPGTPPGQNQQPQNQNQNQPPVRALW